MKLPRKRFNPDSCHWTRVKHSKWKTKVEYETEEDAKAALTTHLKLQGMHAYLCPICNKWHLGHK